MEQIIKTDILDKIKKIKSVNNFGIKDYSSSDNNTFEYGIDLSYEGGEFEFILEFKRVKGNSYILLPNKIIMENVEWTLYNELENCSECGSNQSYYSNETIINDLPMKLINLINALIIKEKLKWLKGETKKGKN